MFFRFQSTITILVGIAILVMTSCRHDSEALKHGTETLELDSLVENAHQLIDTGYQTAYEQLKNHLSDLEKRCIEKGNDDGLARVYLMRGSMERWRQNYLNGLNWCHKAYDIVKLTNSRTELDILLEIGDIYRDLNKKRLANEFYLRANDVAKVSSNLTTRSVVTNRLGIIFYAQHDFDLALENFKKTLDIVEAIKYDGEHNTKKSQILNNIGLCYVQKGYYDSALMYYDSALGHIDLLMPKMKENSMGVVWGNIGRVYQLKGEYEIALDKLKKNIAINGRPGYDNGDAVTSYTYLLEIYNKLDSTELFEANMAKALALTYEVKQARMKEWRARLMGLLSSFHAKRNNYKGAYYYQSQQSALNDSIAKVNETENLQDLILFRELNDKTEKVAELEKENASKQLRLQAVIVISVAVLLTLIITVFFLNYYRRNLSKQKKLNKQVEFQNEQITLNKMDLEQAIEELKLLNAEKNRLLGMVAHDLRGPIYNITGVLQLLEGSDGYSKLDAADVQLIELIKRSCENALEVINDLLEAAHLDNSGMEIDKKEQNLADVVKGAIRLYENRAQQKQIEIVLTEPEQPVMAWVSMEKFGRAVGNLLSNAIKFSHANSKIMVVLSEVNGHALISVADEGVGIPDGHREAIFDKFTRAKRHGTEGEKPVGLGMSIVKQIVDAHNGRIWFDSEVNRGTTFYIEIPLKG